MFPLKSGLFIPVGIIPPLFGAVGLLNGFKLKQSVEGWLLFHDPLISADCHAFHVHQNKALGVQIQPPKQKHGVYVIDWNKKKVHNSPTELLLAQ